MNSSHHQLNKPRLILLVVAFVILLIPSFVFAQDYVNNVKATITSEPATITAGTSLKFTITLNHAPGWHTYYKEPGDAGLPTTLKWTLPEGFTASEIDWPTPTKFSEEGLTTYGYSGIAKLPVTITTPKNLAAASYDFTVKAEWLACKEICIPETQTLNISVPVSTTPVATTQEPTAQKKTPGAMTYR